MWLELLYGGPGGWRKVKLHTCPRSLLEEMRTCVAIIFRGVCEYQMVTIARAQERWSSCSPQWGLNLRTGNRRRCIGSNLGDSHWKLSVTHLSIILVLPDSARYTIKKKNLSKKHHIRSYNIKFQQYSLSQECHLQMLFMYVNIRNGRTNAFF